jgi:predicted dehydrogenase/threonine dehydrogenase-like Zn-dependent dehydrogenase
MKIVVQNFKTGLLSVGDTPIPQPHPNGILVRSIASLISAGTDRAVIALARKGYIGKALDRPDLVRKVLNKARSDGVWATYQVVRNLISEPIPLGYSLVGEVIETTAGITEVSIGDRVACAGLGYANHAEFVSVPRNLFVPVPHEVIDEQAAYVTLGAIAMHGVHQAGQQLGAVVLIIGLGLIGQITVQLSRAAGYRVIGLDPDERKQRLALKNGAMLALNPEDPQASIAIGSFTRGIGVDAAILAVSSRQGRSLFQQIAALCRDRARIVVVGDVKMDISRRTYFEKELELVQSRSYGPGRYDPSYEEKGQDYPVGYVRWTQRRNMAAFLDLVADRRVDMATLTTHRFPVEQATDAYKMITENTTDLTVGVVLTYGDSDSGLQSKTPPEKRPVTANVRLGVIGTGQFAKGILLPAMFATGGFSLAGVASARGISAEAVVRRYRGTFATTDIMQILDDPAIDAIIVATRHDTHGRYVTEALRRDKHVFVEKPLCISADELAEIEAAASTSRGILMVGYNRRFSPLFKLLVEHFTGRVEPLSLIYRVNAGRILLKSETGWVHDPAIGGGRIIGEACHFVDTMQAAIGARPISVLTNAVNPRRADLASDDIVTLTIEFEDGSSGTLHYFSNGDSSYSKERLEIFCQERIGVLENFRTLQLVARGRTTNKRTLNIQKGHDEESLAFLEACRSGSAPISLQSLIDTARVTFCASDALRSNRQSGDLQ